MEDMNLGDLLGWLCQEVADETTSEDAVKDDVGEDAIKNEIDRTKADIAKVRVEKRQRLKTMDFFCLDNSLRESTVGQLRSHTLENKKNIYKEIKKAGMTDVIVASFAHVTRVDDDFCQWLVDEKEDMSGRFSFSEVYEGVKDGVFNTEKVPISLKKNLKYGIANTVLEVDLASDDVEWGVKVTVDDMCKLIFKRVKWIHKKHPAIPKPRILLNLRDFPMAMQKVQERVLKLVIFLAKLPPKYKIFGFCFEDGFGEFLPDELAAWTASLRRVMDSNNWEDGKILTHIHEKWDLQTAATLDCLSAGADGMWASLCAEGAALGHACSTVTMMNLIRMGNKKVQAKYNCKYFRNAAINITKLTTGNNPHPKQPIYGARAADLVFGGMGIGEFDVADFFGMEAPTRITSLASVAMIIDRLQDLFGKNPQFNETIAGAMKELILTDLRSGRKEEYMSKAGLAILFDRSGGKLTEEMGKAIARVKLSDAHHTVIVSEIKEFWDDWNIMEEGRDYRYNCLSFDAFYHGFMAPYFGCYRCPDTKRAFKAIDMDKDDYVDWDEFLVYIKWALRQYPDITTADETLSIAFEKGLIPAMRDEKIRRRDDYKYSIFRDF